MKVDIGPYVTWFGPYQLADKLLFWLDEDDDRREKLGDWLAHGGKDDSRETWLYKFLLWRYSKKERKVKIQIDDYDAWNADITMALIILPLLKKLQKDNNGSAHVDLDDVPDYLKPPAEVLPAGDVDSLFHQRWDWVLNEIIWAFEQQAATDDWEALYHKPIPNVIILDDGVIVEPVDESSNYFDREGWNEHNKRIDRGLRFFGKYYRGLWD